MSGCEQRVVISLADMPALFGIAQQSAWRLNTDKGGKGRLPAPDFRSGGVPFWFEDTIREWAATRPRKLTVDEAAIVSIRLAQCD